MLLAVPPLFIRASQRRPHRMPTHSRAFTGAPVAAYLSLSGVQCKAHAEYFTVCLCCLAANGSSLKNNKTDTFPRSKPLTIFCFKYITTIFPISQGFLTNNQVLQYAAALTALNLPCQIYHYYLYPPTSAVSH